MSLQAALARVTTPELTPAAIAWWSAGAFAFLCALCLYQQAQRVLDLQVSAQQAQRWRHAPALAMHLTYGSVRLSGSVPTQASRERLLGRAREVFGAQAVIDALRVQDGAVPDDWLDTAVSLLWLAGKKIDNGKIEMAGARVQVSGTVAEAAAKIALVDNLHAVLSEHAVLDARLTLAPKHAHLAAALARLVPPGTLLFRVQSAVLTPDAKRALDRAAEPLRKSTARIGIVAYADAVDAPGLSQRLSALRAKAVRDYLIERGVAPQQLRATGAGETSARAGADLPNRRAELRVIESE